MALAKADGGGLAELLGFGVRRLKIVYWLSQHAELDGHEWRGQVTLHIGESEAVKVQVLPAPEAVRMPNQETARV